MFINGITFEPLTEQTKFYLDCYLRVCQNDLPVSFADGNYLSLQQENSSVYLGWFGRYICCCFVVTKTMEEGEIVYHFYDIHIDEYHSHSYVLEAIVAFASTMDEADLIRIHHKHVEDKNEVDKAICALYDNKNASMLEVGKEREDERKVKRVRSFGYKEN